MIDHFRHVISRKAFYSKARANTTVILYDFVVCSMFQKLSLQNDYWRFLLVQEVVA